MSLSYLPAVYKDLVSGWRQTREPTKLECGLLGALCAAIVLAFLFWLNIQIPLLTLISQSP